MQRRTGSPGPQTFSLEAWLRTSTTNGGKIIGFGDSRTGRSGSNGNDRNLYMNNSGSIYFGVRPDMGTRVTINSPSTYRDNQWHHVVATLGSDGMKLYVDGNQVAANANVKKAQVYRGYWRVGGDNLSSWPSTPNREAITANLDEVAVYPQALTLGHVRAHYLASGRSTVFPNINPTAAFTNTTHYLTATVDGTGSTDDDGTISSYAWDFGDGATGTGATAPHTYANAGTLQRDAHGDRQPRRHEQRLAPRHSGGPAAEHPAGGVVHDGHDLPHRQLRIDVDGRGRHDRHQRMGLR